MPSLRSTNGDGNGGGAKKITQADLQATAAAATKPAATKPVKATKISLDALEATAAAGRGGRGRGPKKAAPTADGGDAERDAKPQRLNRPKKERGGHAKPTIVAKGTPPPQRRNNNNNRKANGNGTASSAVEHHKGGHALEKVHFAGADDAAPAKAAPGKGRNANNGSKRGGGLKSAVDAHKGAHADEKVHFTDNDSAEAKPARGKKGSKGKTAVEQHKGEHVDEKVHFADAGDAPKRGAKSARNTRKPAVKKNEAAAAPTAAKGKVRGGKRTAEKPRIKSAPAQVAKAKATTGRNKPRAESKVTVVYSECGRDHHEVMGRVDPIHHQTLGGIRRLRHGSWAVAINSPWLDGKPATDSGKAGPAKLEPKQKKSRQVRTQKKLVHTHDGRHSMLIAGDAHPIHDQTLGGQRAQKHASWRANIQSAWLDSDDGADDEDDYTAPAPLPPHIAFANVKDMTSKEKRIMTHTEDGRMSLRKKKGGDYHPVHDLTLGGQRRQKHKSWSAVITSDWQKGPQERESNAPVTHFVSIPITDKKVHSNLEELQKAVLDKAPANKPFQIPPAKFHISVAMIRKPAGMHMDEFESQLAHAYHDIHDIVAETLGNPVKLKLGPPSTFGKEAAIVTLQPWSTKLMSHLSLVIYEQLTMRGINVDTPNPTPHITLFKRSQSRNKRVRALDAKAITDVKKLTTGVEPCKMVDLCCMKGGKAKQYYPTLASLVL